MKTPREVLFGHYQAAEPKLDAIREQVVAGVAQTSQSAVSQVSKPARSWAGVPTWKSAIRQVGKPAPRSDGPSALHTGWRRFCWSLRWHLAGLSGAWLVVMALSIAPTPRQRTRWPRRMRRRHGICQRRCAKISGNCAN